MKFRNFKLRIFVGQFKNYNVRVQAVFMPRNRDTVPLKAVMNILSSIKGNKFLD